MKKLLLVLFTCLLTLSCFAGEKVTIHCYSNNNGSDVVAAKRAAELYMKSHPDITVKVIAGAKSTTDYLSLILQNFEARSPHIDVFYGDVIWPGDLSEHLLPLNKYFTKEEIAEYNSAVIENNTVDGELKAIPLFIDVPMLYYRTDLLEKYGYDNPPKTWKELEEMATKIQAGERKEGNSELWGFVWQGDAYEGLTCNALEWISSNDGGSIVEPDGTISINNKNVIEALEYVAKWIGTICPKGVLGYQEEDSRAMWQAGFAVFMRNWPYAYSLSQSDDSAVKGKVGFTMLPKGKGKNSSTIGGWEIYVSKYSANPDAAVDFAKFAAGFEVQKIRALDYGFLPALMTVYKDPEIASNDFFSAMGPIVATGVARPSTATAPNYAEVSRIFYSTVHKVISGEIKANRGAREMAIRIKKVIQ